MAVNGGVKNWTTGQVLDAEDLNEFVADQTIARFATISDRTAAYGITGAPSLQKGLFSWVESTEKLYYYDGSSWEEVGAQVEDGEITEAKLADSAVTSAKIANGTIVNADINASAAIDHSKLASITSARVLMGNSSNVPTATALSGDVTIDSSGVTAIGSGVIVNADIGASAAIAYSKLNLATSIVNADISSSAAIDRNKIADSTIDTKTANYTLVLADKNKFIEMNVSSANTVSVPTDASVDFPIGSQINITQYGTGKTQIVAVTPATTSVRATPGAYLRAQYSSATLVKRAANEWYLIGDLSAS
jgi:hypothetical protein